jgi:UDPglucose--hexose-1-phosphate uridylyltransferase
VWEQRWHPLREEWVIIAAHRQHRPWSGEEVRRMHVPLPTYVEECYLCPGNRRVDGQRNPAYRQTFVFDNDLPCVAPDAPAARLPVSPLYRSSNARGCARVVCYTPRHDLTLAELDEGRIEGLLRVWQAQYTELGDLRDVAHVLIFENKGDVVGVSNPHPHCQIYATNFVFKTIESEVRITKGHFAKTGRVLFRDVIDAERRDGRRVLAENDSAIAFVPYFARYAYETYVAPKDTHPNIAALSKSELRDLAAILKEVLVRFDNLWQMSFPYVMTLHQAPTDGGLYPSMHFHIEFHPPLRTPTLLKYLAGPEIGGGNFLSDTSPEEKAAELQAVSTVHYKHAGRRKAAGR